MTKHAPRPVIGTCEVCSQSIRQGTRHESTPTGGMRHLYNCTQHGKIQHKWEAGVDTAGHPALVCSTCGYIWETGQPVPKRGCTH